MLDYMRIGCAVPAVKVCNVTVNTEAICRYMTQADEKDCDLVVFPELSVTGYTCADLLFQDKLLRDVLNALFLIAKHTVNMPRLTAVVGAPICLDGQLYNCAVVMGRGKILGIVPKTHLPDYKEFSENRWFRPANELTLEHISALQLGCAQDYLINVGTHLLFRMGEGTMVGVEICEDLWSSMPPSSALTLNGAEVIVNLSASNETVGKRMYRRKLVEHQSAVCHCVYAFCSAGCTESTQDLVYSGHALVAENGRILAENENLIDTDYLLVQDVDIGKVRAERRVHMRKGAAHNLPQSVIVDCELKDMRSDGDLYPLRKLTFVPNTPAERLERCNEVFQIQVEGLAQRLRTINAKAVVGVSGGLDSTLALLVAVEAVKKLGRPVTDVHAVFMPSFGTSKRTGHNAQELIRGLGVSSKTVDIRDAVRHHFCDIGHDEAKHNATYENAQARERTQVLMDYAGMVGGIVVGTGDLSELALGWCTYNADQMSMYGVNASVPKTLIPWIIDTVSQTPAYVGMKPILDDILNTPISPELLPPDKTGKITQQTEDIVGPYALHDFFLYYHMRFGFAPGKVFTLACRAFADAYDAETIKKWMGVFYRRFFAQQFKRSAMPDGIKIGTVSLSPRGDWRMPSDADAQIWLDELDSIE